MSAGKPDARQLQFDALLVEIVPAPVRKRYARKASTPVALDAPLLAEAVSKPAAPPSLPEAIGQAATSLMGDLRREIGRVAGVTAGSRDGQLKDFRAFTPAPPDVRLQEEKPVHSPTERGPFGRWLLRQGEREDLIGMLAKGALVDHRFPASGTPQAVRKHLRRALADSEIVAALDEAELEWSCY